MTLKALRYLGGKDARGVGSGTWVASMLPTEWDQTYCEPFFGMGGVFRQRAPVRTEILNDLNGRVINWWRVVRDRTDELAYLLEWSPAKPGRDEFAWAVDHADDPDPVRAAYALSVALSGGYIPTAENDQYSHSLAVLGRLPTPDRIRALAGRLKNVLLENRDATDLIDRYLRKPDVVVYCDPPYYSTPDTSDSYGMPFDTDRFSAVLQACPGRVLLSGYGSEWDHLGWDRHEKPVLTSLVNRYGDADAARTEVAWANYPVAHQQKGLF